MVSANRATRSAVFVSYSHADKKWLQSIQVVMKQIEREHQIEYWDDTRIKAGSDWRRTIEDALSAARVAILLISHDFLASDFITNDELPRLLKAAEDGGLAILPVIVRPSRFSSIPSLSRIQSLNSPDKSLAKLPTWRREEILTELVEEVLRLLKAPPPTVGPLDNTISRPLSTSAPADPLVERGISAPERYLSLTGMRLALARCKAVARVETHQGDGVGTGFLIAGRDLHAELPERVFVTCTHLLPEYLAISEAVVSFNGLAIDGRRSSSSAHRIRRQCWYAPSGAPGLDTSLLELDDLPDDVEALPIARGLPSTTYAPRVYLIGHPRGIAEPQFSLYDSQLIDYDERVIHYRAETAPGSTGSPVFDQNWRVIGVHRNAGPDLPRLNDRGGTYAAKEAISIFAVKSSLAASLPAAH